MKKNIAVVYGGYSGEFDISEKSGEVVASYLDPEQYNVYPIRITKKDWTHTCKHDNNYEIDKNDFSLPMIAEKIHFNGVFIAIHGTPGEDGKLQGYFDMIGLPYTTSDHVVSALTFNKHLCKLTVQSLGILTAKSVILNKKQKNSETIISENLKLPVFVKPNNGGSSVGMSKVDKDEQLGDALKKAFAEDDELLVEEFIKGREITCGVYQYKNETTALPVTEIISKKEWFDFEAKYDPELADEIVPANIPKDIFLKCQQTSKDLYKALACRGIVRFDYIYNDSGMYFLEVNTVPGLTEESIVPKMAESAGISLSELFNRLMEEALWR